MAEPLDGGGKSDYLLMAASQYCEYPDYSALIIRKSYQDLSLPGAIMDRAITWWAGQHGIMWRPAEHKMIWPSGAVIQFGHLGNSTDHLRYQGAELDFIGIDEATQIPAEQLTYLHSRLRNNDPDIPLRYRLATNPGGPSHDFVRDEYVRGADGKTRIYLPALLSENPGLDQEAYMFHLSRLDPITRKRLEEGDWDVYLSAGFFEVESIGSFTTQDLSSHVHAPMVRAWDLAATPDSPGADPDYTVGILMALVDGEAWVVDMKRARLGPANVERLISQTAEEDGHDVKILIEREPGASGVIAHRHMAAQVLSGYNYRSKRVSGSKYDRAKPLASAVSNGLFRWREDAEGRFDAMAELRAFNEDESTYAHDDIVDALSLAFNDLTRGQRKRGMGIGAAL